MTLDVNAAPVSVEIEANRLLVQILREDLGLTGTHIGCETSQCGACTVLLDGQAVKSCTLFAIQADGREITTIEGLAHDGLLHPLQQAFLDCAALQCGYCTPGMIMSAVALLRSDPQPDDHTIRAAIAGNLCRCTGYQSIVEAVHRASLSAGGSVGGR